MSFVTSLATLLDAIFVGVLALLIFLILPKIFIRPKINKNVTNKSFTRLDGVFTFELNDTDKQYFKSVDIEGDEKSNTLVFNVQDGINDVVLTLCIFDDYGKPIDKRLCHASLEEGKNSFEIDIHGDSRNVDWFVNGINRSKFTSDNYSQKMSRSAITTLGALNGALFGVLFYFISDLLYSIFYTIIQKGEYQTSLSDPLETIKQFSRIGTYVSIGIGVLGLIIGATVIREKYSAYFAGGYEDDQNS